MRQTKLTITLLFLVLTVRAWAQNAVAIYQTDGNVTKFAFTEKPVVTYSNNELVLTTSSTSVQYPIYLLKKLAFEIEWDVETAIEEVKASDVRYNFRDGSLYIIGGEPDSIATLYNLKGIKVCQYRLDAEGKTTIPLQTLGKDTYIVKAGNLSFKFRQS